MKGWLKRVDSYWFGFGSPAAMCLFRILIGTWASISVFLLLLDWQSWFTPSGYAPQSMIERYAPPLAWRFTLFGHLYDFGGSVPRINLMMGLSPTWSLVFLIGVFTLAIAVAVGYRTRVTTILLAIGIVSIHHRNMLFLQGADTTLRICCWYLALMPCGLMYSLDRRRQLWKDPFAGIKQVSLWPQRVTAVNCAIIYLTTFWLKFGYAAGNHWRDGTATWYPTRLAEFERFPLPAFATQMPMVTVTTYLTLVIEVALASLVFYRPTRKWALLGGILLHAGIDYSLNIPLFGFIITSMYVLFYSGDEVHAWVDRTVDRLGFRKQEISA
jgi:hypothetical protein